jgi:hypothetical protein
MSKPKKPYPKGHPLYEEQPKQQPKVDLNDHEQVESVAESVLESVQRVRTTLSISCQTDEIFSVAAACLGVTKTSLMTSLLMQSLPTLREQVDAMRGIMKK